jgi:hypothetical protein
MCKGAGGADPCLSRSSGHENHGQQHCSLLHISAPVKLIDTGLFHAPQCIRPPSVDRRSVISILFQNSFLSRARQSRRLVRRQTRAAGSGGRAFRRLAHSQQSRWHNKPTASPYPYNVPLSWAAIAGLSNRQWNMSPCHRRPVRRKKDMSLSATFK